MVYYSFLKNSNSKIIARALSGTNRCIVCTYLHTGTDIHVCMHYAYSLLGHAPPAIHLRTGSFWNSQSRALSGTLLFGLVWFNHCKPRPKHSQVTDNQAVSSLSCSSYLLPQLPQWTILQNCLLFLFLVSFKVYVHNRWEQLLWSRKN